MNKSLCKLLTVTVCLLLMCGCARHNDNEKISDPDTPLTFTDDMGMSVTLPAQPQKVAVLFSSHADLWQTAGGEIAVTVGESVERGFADADCVLVDIGSGHSTIDLETLIAADVDLVIGTTDYACQTEAVDFCRRAGIPAAAFRVESFADYLRVLRIFTDITERPDLYETHGTAVAARIEDLTAQVRTYLETTEQAPRVLFIRAGSSAKSTKAKLPEDHFACAMLADLGAVNVAQRATVLTEGLSLEEIVLQDPQAIFVTTMGDRNAAVAYINRLFTEDGWRELSAVQSGQVHILPKELFHFKPNARWAQAYEELIRALYPEMTVS